MAHLRIHTLEDFSIYSYELYPIQLFIPFLQIEHHSSYKAATRLNQIRKSQRLFFSKNVGISKRRNFFEDDSSLPEVIRTAFDHGSWQEV